MPTLLAIRFGFVVRLCLLFCFWCTCFSAPRARAEAPTSEEFPSLEHKLRSARGAQIGAGAGLALLGGAAGVVLGGATTAIICVGGGGFESGCGHLWATAPIGAVLGVTMSTGAAMRWTGRRRGLNGSFTYAWLGSMGGMALGAGLGLTAIALPDVVAAGAVVTASALTGTVVGAIWGFNRSVRGRARRNAALVPTVGVGAERAGLVLGLAGTF